MDLITIVVPCYNVEKYVKRCILSIKKQKYRDLEILMIDDGSTDNTKNVIKKNIKGDNRFKYFEKSNGGLSDARNYGIERSNGKYICFIDSDDYVNEDYIFELYNNIKNLKNSVSVCYFDRVYDKKNKLNKIENSIPFMIKHPAAWNKMYDLEFIKKNKLYFLKGIWYEDLNFFLKFLSNTNTFNIVKKSLYYYIQNPSSIMHKVDDRIFQIFDCLEDVEKYIEDNKKDKKNYDYIEFAYVYHVLIGTVFRASFFDDFSVKTINNIIERVINKYPHCWNNQYIKTLPFVYKLYLKMLKNTVFRKIICFILKRFNKYMNL